MSNPVSYDVRVHAGLNGSPTMLEITTPEAHNWVKVNLPVEGWMWLANRLFANYFDLDLVLSQMEAEGLIVDY